MGHYYIVECHDCGWSKKFPPAGTMDDRLRSAKAAKAGHIGGGRSHGETRIIGDCENVEIREPSLGDLLVEEP